jgi:YtkA-like
MWRWAGAVIAVTALGCAGDPGAGGAGGASAAMFPEAPLATLSSDNGKLKIEVRTAPDQPPSRGLVTVELRVADAAGKPVDGLDLGVLPWMPDMGHGASTTPDIQAEGGGRYVANKVALFMPGRWELRTKFTGAAEDSATVAFQIP